ncbi:hypothetical protein MKW92_021296 [Papaver armeniacum]|nr:hypothetical protein MKW92_021296 [Papaver armeniacum]
MQPTNGCFSATQDNFKYLRSLEEGKSSAVTVRGTRKREELDYRSTNEVTSVDMVIVDEETSDSWWNSMSHHSEVRIRYKWKFLVCSYS